MAWLAREDVSFGEIADLVERDPVMAGSVLLRVNSAMYAWRGRISSVRNAVALIGFAKLRNTVMTLSLARMLHHKEVTEGTPSWSPAQLYLHATASAILADQIAAELNVDYPEGAFAAGLLQNIGMLLIAVSHPNEHERIKNLCERGGQPVIEAERIVIGLDHTELSAEAVAQWKLPAPIGIAVRNHHGPHEGTIPLSRVVETADRIASLRGITAQDWLHTPVGDVRNCLENIGLAHRAEHILYAFEKEYEVARVFFN